MNRIIFFSVIGLLLCSCTEQKIPLPTDPDFGYEIAFSICKNDDYMHGYQDSLFSKKLQIDETYENIANRKYLDLPYGERSKKLFEYFLGIDNSLTELPSISFYGLSSFFNNDKQVSEGTLQYFLNTKLYWNNQYKTPENKACLTIVDVLHRADSSLGLENFIYEHNIFKIKFPCEKRTIEISSAVRRGIDERYEKGPHLAVFGMDELELVYAYAKKKNIGKITNYINLLNDLDSTTWSKENIENSKEFQEIAKNYSGYHISDPMKETGHKDDFTAEEVGDWFDHVKFPSYPKEKYRNEIPVIPLTQERYVLKLYLMDTLHRVDKPIIPVTMKIEIEHAKLIPQK